MPHFPLTAPAEFFALYPPDTLPMPKCGKDYVPENATMAALRLALDYDAYFRDDDAVRRAVAGYFGIVSALDHNVGRVLGALAGAGLGDTTRIIYTSDHGDNVGARGFWGKSTMWQESAGVPLVIAGPGIPPATVCNTPASLLDLHATVVSWAGVPDIDDGRHRPGRDLLELSRGADPDRAVMSQYHAVGAPTGIFMLRWGIWKLIECFGDAPILYDLAADPEEMTNLAADPAHAADLAACRAKLAEFGDIAEINARAFADQAAMIDRVGGEAAIRATTPIAYTAPPGPGAA
jgi:choline-sulfatase